MIIVEKGNKQKRSSRSIALRKKIFKEISAVVRETNETFRGGHESVKVGLCDIRRCAIRRCDIRRCDIRRWRTNLNSCKCDTYEAAILVLFGSAGIRGKTAVKIQLRSVFPSRQTFQFYLCQSTRASSELTANKPQQPVVIVLPISAYVLWNGRC